MDPHALLIWGLTVWLALSSQECNAAAYKGRFYSQDGVSSDPPVQGHQDTSSGTIEPGETQQVKVIPIMGGSASPVTKEDITRVKAAENPKTSTDVPVISKDHPTNDARTDSKPDSQSSMPEFTEEGIEEEDENGIIRGKYSYIEEDGVPAQIEYEAVPGVKFEVKTYIKGFKVIPFPNLIESPKTGQTLIAGQSNANLVENKNNFDKVGLNDFSKPNVENSKTTSTILMERDPEYEHASVIGRYNFKTLSRKTRTINDHDQNSESDLALESEIKAESTENDNSQVNSEPSADASYKFGFSADGQTRDEEADAQGNVQGSYSYIGEDGILTRVEYEAGSGKGFVVKKILKEDTRRSLEVPQSPGLMNLDESSDQLNSKVVVSPPISSNQEVQSEDHQIQTPQKKVPIVVNKGQNDGEEETENEDKISMNQNSDGSYSFSYATPDQWREESVDSTGHIKSRFSFTTPGDNKIKQTQYEDVLTKGDQDFNLPLIHTLQAPKFVSLPPLTNFKTNGLNINSDGSYSFSYVTPHQYHTEDAQIKTPDSFLPKEGVTTQQENEESNGGMDLSTSQNLQDNTANVDNPSPIQNYRSYSYSYETTDQMKQEAGDIDGNVQGQYSYVADDGIRRTVHYKAGPESGFVAESSHLPSTENAGSSNAEEVKASVAQFIAPMELENPTPHPKSNHKNISPVSGSVDQLPVNTDSSNKNLHYEGNTYPTVGFIPQQGSDGLSQVILDLSGIRRADATKDNGHIHKYKTIIKKRPIEPTIPAPTNSLSDGSYSFAYDNKDQLREESVDTNGNVYSNYQYKTKDGGRTVVVFIRKRVKDGANEDIGSAASFPQKQVKRNIALQYVNDDRSYQNDRFLGGRNRFNRKRHVQGLSDHNINNYNPAELQDSQVNSNKRTSFGSLNMFQNAPSIPITNESTGTKTSGTIYRRAKSIVRPFRGNVRYQRQII